MECLTKDIDTAFTLFAELMQHPRFDSAKFQLAIDNAIEDWRRRNDSPGRITSREFAKLLYGDHPYGRSADKTILESFTRDDVTGLYNRSFAPGNTILAVSGDLTKDQLNELLSRHFGNWSATAAALPDIPPVPDDATGGVYQIRKDINQTNLRFGHVGIDQKNPDRHAVRVMNYILGGGGFTSRMMGRVRSDSGWAYSVGTRFTMGVQPGMFYASCQTKSETTAKTLKLMKWVIEDLLKNGITDDELATAKESILNSDVFQYVTPSQIVNRYAWLEYYDYPSDQLKKNVEAIRAVTKRDVEMVAHKYLHPDKFTILAVGPVENLDAPLSSFGTVTTLELEE
jgi:predicted Zn-dependent peptidase